MHGFWRAALYAAALGILAHPVGQALPRRWFDPYQAPYRCRDWEQGGRVYNKLHIRRWKDRLPDMSRLMPDMVKKKLAAADPMSLVQETCVAECVHCWLVVLSVGMLFLWKSVWSWALWLVYNLLGNVSFILIQPRKEAGQNAADIINRDPARLILALVLGKVCSQILRENMADTFAE